MQNTGSIKYRETIPENIGEKVATTKDLEIIRKIERLLVIKLKQVPFEEIHKKDFYTVSTYYYTLSDLQSEDFYFKGARNYTLDEKGRITGLSLDSCAVYLFLNGLLRELPHLRFLSLSFDFI